MPRAGPFRCSLRTSKLSISVLPLFLFQRHTKLHEFIAKDQEEKRTKASKSQLNWHVVQYAANYLPFCCSLWPASFNFRVHICLASPSDTVSPQVLAKPTCRYLSSSVLFLYTGKAGFWCGMLWCYVYSRMLILVPATGFWWRIPATGGRVGVNYREYI